MSSRFDVIAIESRRFDLTSRRSSETNEYSCGLSGFMLHSRTVVVTARLR